MASILTHTKSYLLAKQLRQRDMIDFAIIGFPKCATSSIYRNLAASNHISMPNTEVPINAYIRGDINFPSDSLLKGIKNPNLPYKPHQWMALFKANPNIRFIIGLRNPAEWLYSFYQYRKNEILSNREWLSNHIKHNPKISEISFGDIVYNNQELFGASLEHGKFVKWLTPIAKIVPKDHVFLYFVEALERNPNLIYNDLSKFLSIEYRNASFIETNRNSSIHKTRDIYQAELEYLNQHYQEWNERLNELILSKWRITNKWW